MSSLSSLFASGGGSSRFNKDPRLLGRYKVASYGQICVFDLPFTNSFTVAATFTTHLASQGAVASIVSADTYVTIANITGSGFFFGAVSPTCDSGSNNIATFRITIDGTVYTITSPANIAGASSVYSTFRFLIGTLIEGVGQQTSLTDPISSGPSSFVNYNNFSVSGGIARTPATAIIPHNEQMLKYNFPAVRFESSLLVECKFSAYTVTDPYPRCSAQYQLDTY